VALASAGCTVPARTIRPVIHAHEDEKYEAMKSAPVIVVAELLETKIVSDVRQVKKPTGIGGPDDPTIPMALGRISARITHTLRGRLAETIQFYSWMFAGPMHGGPRLFHPWPGTFHVLFLRQEGGYLHTIGDYPTYDMEISREVLPAFISRLKAGSESGSDLFERIVLARLMAELESARDFGGFAHPVELHTLAGLTSPLYVASRLDSFCRQFPNPFGRYTACLETAQQFPGRCNAYHLAGEAESTGVKTASIAESFEFCRRFGEKEVDDLRSWMWPPTNFYYNWGETAERRRLAIQLFASAMDSEFHTAACEIAATMPDAHDIPECAASGAPLPAPAGDSSIRSPLK
jgi:hypothetical protein